jgi:membrane protein implicated in regulation of membrane protease activity
VLFLYLAANGLGLTLIAVSLLLGGGDADADLDADLDGDGPGDVDGAGDVDAADAGHGAAAHASGSVGITGWLPLASLRFWTFLVAAFGLTGTGLTLGGAPWVAALAVAAATGIVGGWSAAHFFRYLLTDRVSGDMSLDRLVGREARVALPVRPEGRGRISVATSGGVLELTAVTRDGRPILRGETVLIASITDGVADVTALDPRPRQIAGPNAEPVGAEGSDPVSS